MPVSYTHLDINVVIQSYNYGGGYADYVAKNGKKHSFNLAEMCIRDRDTVANANYRGVDVDWYVKADDIVLKNKGTHEMCIRDSTCVDPFKIR